MRDERGLRGERGWGATEREKQPQLNKKRRSIAPTTKSYAWTIISNVAVFLVYLLLTDLNHGRSSEILLSNFRILGFFCAATGAAMTAVFLLGTHEDVGRWVVWCGVCGVVCVVCCVVCVVCGVWCVVCGVWCGVCGEV